MGYRIGEVSKLLGLPVETIRYYEKEQIITPKRLENSDYRTYETWDIFFLMECMRYRSFDISLKDISRILHSESLDFFVECIDQRQQKIEEKLHYYKMLERKISDYKRKLESLPHNVGCYWFVKTPEYRYFTYVQRSNGDNYGTIQDKPMFSEWLNYIPFVEFTHHVHFSDILDHTLDCDTWGMCVESADANLLHLPSGPDECIRPAGLCLCTVMDLGDYGNLTLRQFDPLATYIWEHDLIVTGEIIGKVLTRVHADQKMHRYIEYTVPVKKKQQ